MDLLFKKKKKIQKPSAFCFPASFSHDEEVFRLQARAGRLWPGLRLQRRRGQHLGPGERLHRKGLWHWATAGHCGRGAGGRYGGTFSVRRKLKSCADAARLWFPVVECMTGFCPVDPPFSLPLPCKSLSLRNLKRGFQSDEGFMGWGEFARNCLPRWPFIKKKKIDKTVLPCLIEL